jgi:protein TonB
MAPVDRQRILRYGLIVLGILLSAALVVYAVKSLMSGTGKAKKPSVQTIAVLRPPPPPPPPKPEEKPPEPEIKKEEVKLPDPEPEPQQADDKPPPPGPDLGVDAEGTGAGDGFGLVGKKGGQDITTLGQGGGGGVNRAQFALFTNLVQAHLQEELSKNRKLRSADYRVVLRVWFAQDGRVSRTELASSSGDSEIDQAIRTTLADGAPLRQPPPPEMPQPLKLRLTSRGAG